MKSNKYSCNTRAETLEWIIAIIDFLKPFSFLINAHVVNFFKDKQWEAVDVEWMSCLKDEKPENILLIPSGGVQDHWPTSLKEFVHTLRSLSFPREQADLHAILADVDMVPLSTVLSQGMNLKKKHEVEVLSSVVSSVVKSVGAPTVVDVGAGQGYLAQVLSFQYKHSVVAIDSSSHHGKVTDARAARIRKHFAAQMRKSGSGNKCPDVPMTITCRVLSTEMLKALTDVPLEKNDTDLNGSALDEGQSRSQSSSDANRSCSLVLAGLHACGDLSVTMLRTFMECEEVKAVVSIGCCYNLLSEKSSEDSCSKCGYPMSAGLKSLGFSLGKNARDLACQSAERWSGLGEDAGLQNFELHSFRAAFQMVLSKHYPEVLATSPSIGRQGKAFRRQQQRKSLETPAAVDTTRKDTDDKKPMRQTSSNSDMCSSFEKFCLSAFSRLNLEHPLDIDLNATWKEADASTELIGPYWSIRAALGPVLETLILLDRLMFLQEQGDSIKVVMLPIFDPTISPRNVAIIAKRL
ncbi:S-adenosyl-L-methionine-dependent methyltransferase [Arabidopsis thaliana x Arabidopsis arenosa]|uniref:S-adenosyl-L-methionine-dependent methyltransferase n=1 Tax=Arabidopsis thaliana x Arabidopsis arenosa TaxID=1240361 RepID=A0A8T2C1R6_9BRAS|nr:S-adenosyl-L-methionine-dependent methyltransferase [Arabidopsis thaliana x Arabidopsis arenosa]